MSTPTDDHTADVVQIGAHHPSAQTLDPTALVEQQVNAVAKQLGECLARIDGLVDLRALTNKQIKEEREAAVRLRRMIAASTPPKPKGGA